MLTRPCNLGTPRVARPPRAGVSSFGIGGTNAHVVLEEAPAITQSITVNPSAEAEDGKENRSHHLLTLSAKNAAALQALVQRYIDFLADEIQQPPSKPLVP
jgi:acyl transferase domain-containing protein